MEKVYTEIRGTYVFPDSTNINSLKPDSCIVTKEGAKLCITPLSGLKGKQLEPGRNGYSSFWGYGSQKEKAYILLDGGKKDPRFCNLCKDKLNGITGNCPGTKPEGCSFDPADSVNSFRISLDGWKKFRAVDVNEYSGFRVPDPCRVDFSKETVQKNRRSRIIARHLGEYQERKIEKYCTRCIHQGSCMLNSRQVSDHCMVTEEDTIKQCLQKIRKRFGDIEEFLKLLTYSGGTVKYRPRNHMTESVWRVSQPFDRKKFLIVNPYGFVGELKAPRQLVEKSVVPCALPSSDHEKIAALAWYYFETYPYYRLWVLPKPWGIEVTHRRSQVYHFFRRQSFTSIGDIGFFSHH